MRQYSDPDTAVAVGGGYVAMAVEQLRLPSDRVDTIADFEAVKWYGVQSKRGADAATAAVVAELAHLIAQGELEVPTAGVLRPRRCAERAPTARITPQPWQVGAATIRGRSIAGCRNSSNRFWVHEARAVS
jgi:hypothetical protein